MPDSVGSKAVRAADSVVFEELPDGRLLLFNTATQQPFELNAVGAHMWLVIIASGSIDAAIDALLEDFDVEPIELRRDLADFLGQLEARDLIVVLDR